MGGVDFYHYLNMLIPIKREIDIPTNEDNKAPVDLVSTATNGNRDGDS